MPLDVDNTDLMTPLAVYNTDIMTSTTLTSTTLTSTPTPLTSDSASVFYNQCHLIFTNNVIHKNFRRHRRNFFAGVDENCLIKV